MTTFIVQYIFMRRMATIIFLILACCNISAQTIQIRGVVQDATTKEPLPYANVFVNNSTYGTETDAKGHFTLSIPLHTSGELIVSYVSYESLSIQISNTDAAKEQIFALMPKTSLDPVTVRNYEKDGWAKYGQRFLDYFIGTQTFATECTIQNKKALRFYYDHRHRVLEVTATEPLLIQNKYLGYTVHYLFNGLTYDEQSGYCTYSGYPYFEPYKGSASRQKRWDARRAVVYQSSAMYFFRSLYSRKLTENHFSARKLSIKVNDEKERIDSITQRYSQWRKDSATQKIIYENNWPQHFPPDTVYYYKTVISQPYYWEMLYLPLLPETAICDYNGDSVQYSYGNYLYVTIPNKHIDFNYFKQLLSNPRKLSGLSDTAVVSQIMPIPQGANVNIHPNGSLDPILGLIFKGYWAWNEKVCTLLPFDYQPANK